VLKLISTDVCRIDFLSLLIFNAMPVHRKHAASEDAPALAARKKYKSSDMPDLQSPSPRSESGKRSADIDVTKSPSQETQSLGGGVYVSKEPANGEKAAAALSAFHEAFLNSFFDEAESRILCKALGFDEMPENDGLDDDDESDDDDDDVVDSIALNRREAIRQELLDAKHKGIHDLAIEVTELTYADDWFAKLGDEIQKKGPTDFFEILLTTPDIVLEHLLIGDIASASLENENLRKALTLANTKGDDRPAICLQCLTDESGLSPNVGQLRQMMNTMELYCEPDHANTYEKLLLVQIENEFDCMKSGSRKYLCDENGDFINERSIRIRKWIQAMRNRFKGLEDDHIPTSPLCEVEYARHPEKRLKAQAKHDESNYIMNLSEAVCQVLFPDVGFHISHFVLYHLHKAEHSVVAEILFSRLAYITHGAGFNHKVSGLSEASAAEIPATSWSAWCHETFTDEDCLGRIEEAGEQLIRERRGSGGSSKRLLELEDQLSLQLQALEFQTAQKEKLAAERVGEVDD